MRTFRDERGRDWSIHLSIDAVKRAKALAGFDLMRLGEIDANGVPNIQRLAVDVVTVCDVAFAVLKPQADKLGVSDAQFAEGLGGDGMRLLQEAVLAEVRDFFLKLGRTEVVAMIDQMVKFVAATIKASEARVEAIDPEALATRGESSGNSPASVEFRQTG